MGISTYKRLAIQSTGVVLALSVAAPAIALTPGQQRALTFSLTAATAWGVVGGIDILIQNLAKFNGDAAQWSRTAAAVCGTAAAGILQNWKPPQDAINAKNIILSALKSGGIISSANVCKWTTQGLYSGIVSTQSAAASNETVISHWANSTGDWERWNTTQFIQAYNNLTASSQNAGQALANFTYWNNTAAANGCTSWNTTQWCKDVMSNRNTSYNNFINFHYRTRQYAWDTANYVQNAGQISGQNLPNLTAGRP